MQVRRGLALLACAAALLAGASPTPARGAQGLLVGVDDDTAKWMVRPDGLVAAYGDLGLDAVRVTIPWRRGRTRPTRVGGLYLSRAAALLVRGQRVVLAVYGGPAQAPRTRSERQAYCGFLAHVLARIPIRDVVIWNEANSPAFWPAEVGPAGYERLLATCWDRLHGLRPDVNMISSTAAHHDPAGFLGAVGAAYRASGRRRPLVDTFGHNPYPDFATEPPWVSHPDPTTVGEGDLGRLLAGIGSGFLGTPQPLPGLGSTSVWYLEDGFQTAVPRAKRRFYTGVENDRSVLSAFVPSGAAAVVRDQATQLRDALLLARCQPAVGAFFNFELIDDGELAGWQSGLLWRDGTRKPAYDVFRDTVQQLHTGAVDCAAVPGAGAAEDSGLFSRARGWPADPAAASGAARPGRGGARRQAEGTAARPGARGARPS